METQKKRALTKVRRDFLLKKAEKNEEDVDPSTRYLTNSQVNILAGDIGLVEINREVYLELYYANCQYKIDHFKVEKRSHSLVVNIELKPERVNLCPWEYTVKRLESYGDLKLATWAHRIKNSQSNHARFMKSYYETFKSNDSKIFQTIKETKERASLLCRDLESKHAFYKVRYFANEEAKSLASVSFDERFLQKIGHNIEEFGSWVLKNGIPTISEKNATVNLKYGQLLLDYNVSNYESVFEGPEQASRLVDKNGLRKDITMRTVFILEPSAEGIYMNTYYLLIDKPSDFLTGEYLGQSKNASLKLYKPGIEELEDSRAAYKTRLSGHSMEEESH